MRQIIKNKEPKAWIEYRNTPGAVFESKPELRHALLKEQGYICAYCMRRIPVSKPEANVYSKIDHIISQETCKARKDGRELDYKNMVISCPGQLVGNSHCDDSKKSTDLKIDLFSPRIKTDISYLGDGSIRCKKNKDWNNDINNVLYLNVPILKENRKEVLEGVIHVLNAKSWSKARIQTELKKWDSKDINGKYREYCGIVVWFLSKKI